MNRDRTIGEHFSIWPAAIIKRPSLEFLLLLIALVFLVWPFTGLVRSPAAAFGQRLAVAPAVNPIRPPVLSDPLIDRLAAGAQMSPDGRLIVYTDVDAGCIPPCPAQVIIEDAASGKREVASLGLSGMAANGVASDPVLSQDGRYVAYASPASNLVQGDTNAASDVFLYDRTAGITRRLSLAPDGGQADGDSYSPTLSADGRFITFVSYAENLVAGDTNGHADVFLVDLEKEGARLLSMDSSGRQVGRDAHLPAISGDGKIVVFTTVADNLVAGDTNAVEDVFAVDIDSGVIERLTSAADGSQADGDSFDAAISGDGRYIAFASYATNLSAEKNLGVNVFLHDMATREIHCVSCDVTNREGGQAAWKPRFAPDGSLLLFDMLISSPAAGSGDRPWQVYAYDCEHDLAYRLAGAERVSTLGS